MKPYDDLEVQLYRAYIRKDGVIALDFRWGDDCGFGQIYIEKNKDKLICDSEHMGPNFVKAVLCKWVDSFEIVSEEA